MSVPAVFLDRDGTLMEEVHYCSDPALVRVFPGTGAALRRLQARGFLIVIVTNQSGIGRGLLTEEQYRAVQAELIRQLEEAGPDSGRLIAASYFCPDAPPEAPESDTGVPPVTSAHPGPEPQAGRLCHFPRRKPEPGMVFEAASELDIDLARSWFIGDKAVDIECGRRAGTRTILVETGYGGREGPHPGISAPEFVAKDVVAAAEIVLGS